MSGKRMVMLCGADTGGVCGVGWAVGGWGMPRTGKGKRVLVCQRGGVFAPDAWSQGPGRGGHSERRLLGATRTFPEIS